MKLKDYYKPGELDGYNCPKCDTGHMTQTSGATDDEGLSTGTSWQCTDCGYLAETRP